MITSDFHLSKSSSIMKKSNSTSSTTTSSTTSSSICPNKDVMYKNILQNQELPTDVSGDSISPPKKRYFSKFWPFRKFVHSTESSKINQCPSSDDENRVRLLPNISTKISVSKPEMVAKDQIHQRQLSIIKEDEIWEGKSHQEDDSSAAPPPIDAQKMREMKNAGKICDISIIKDDIRNMRKLNNCQIEYIKNLNKAEKDEIIQEYNRSYESMIDAIKIFLEVRSKPNSTNISANVSRSPSFQKVHRLSPELRFYAKSRDSGEIGSS